MSISAKLQSLKAGKILRLGVLVAHQTSTVSGIAASATSKKGIKKAQKFKQRQGPFLLLADCLSTALKQAIYIPTSLRKLAKISWPGAVTLVFPARQHLHSACYQKRTIAVRVDADAETRRLAQICGGLMLSSSLNRRNQSVKQPCFALKYRWHRFGLKILTDDKHHGSNTPSSIYQMKSNHVRQIR
ncbi:MAG: Sua5/YciO/YrdC/YwlC family protein [Ghiorsea sp.]